MIHYVIPKANTQVVGNYGLSYSALKEEYWEIRRMSSEEFRKNALRILHFSCVVCWMKEMPIEVLNDEGLIHELVHLLTPETADLVEVGALKEQFNIVCELA